MKATLLVIALCLVTFATSQLFTNNTINGTSASASGRLAVNASLIANFSRIAVVNASSTANFSQIALVNASSIANFSQIALVNASSIANFSRIAVVNASSIANFSQIAFVNASSIANFSRIAVVNASAIANFSRIAFVNASSIANFSRIAVVNASAIANFSRIAFVNASSIANFSSSFAPSLNASAIQSSTPSFSPSYSPSIFPSGVTYANITTIPFDGNATAIVVIKSNQPANFSFVSGGITTLQINDLIALAGRLAVSTAPATGALNVPGLVSPVYSFRHSLGDSAVTSALLEFNYTAAGLSADQAQNLVWAFFDYSSNLWQQQSSTVNINRQTVAAQTSHFSDWSVQNKQAGVSASPSPVYTATPSPSYSSASTTGNFVNFIRNLF